MNGFRTPQEAMQFALLQQTYDPYYQAKAQQFQLTPLIDAIMKERERRQIEAANRLSAYLQLAQYYPELRATAPIQQAWQELAGQPTWFGLGPARGAPPLPATITPFWQQQIEAYKQLYKELYKEFPEMFVDKETRARILQKYEEAKKDLEARIVNLSEEEKKQMRAEFERRWAPLIGDIKLQDYLDNDNKKKKEETSDELPELPKGGNPILRWINALRQPTTSILNYDPTKDYEVSATGLAFWEKPKPSMLGIKSIRRIK
jgi:hypothetical protein